ncbi:MAG: glycosyltransferase family 4 protein [Roseiarcus sp.]
MSLFAVHKREYTAASWTGGRERLGEVANVVRRFVGARTSAPSIWFDVTDFVDYMLANRTVTGIQRTVRALLAHFSNSRRFDDRNPIRPCYFSRNVGYFSRNAGRFIELPLMELAKTAALFGSARDGPAIDEELASFVSVGTRADFQPADRFLHPGAFWHAEDYAHIMIETCTAHQLEFSIIIRDLIPIRCPQWFSPDYVRSWAAMLQSLLRCARTVFTNSNYTAEDVLAFALTNRIAMSRPIVLTWGCEFGSLSHLRDGGQGRPEQFLDPGFVMMVSTIGPRKNQIGLIPVWEQLVEKHGDRTPYLLLVGKYERENDPIINAIRQSSASARIVVESDVSDGELVHLYDTARFTVFSSLAEGWGNPVGESLARGRLCVASRAWSIPEVGGDLVPYFDPTDRGEMYDVIERYVGDASLRKAAEERIVREYVVPSWQHVGDKLIVHLVSDRVA